jgi:hypothetical protein
MSYRNDEEIGSAIQTLLSKRTATGTRAGCPDENSLAAYVTGSISDQQRDRLEDHLAQCRFCLSEVAAANQAGESGMTTAPQWLMERAMALASGPKQPRVVDLVVRLVKESVELVRQSGDWIPTMVPQPVGVRGTTALSTAAVILQMEKELGGHKVLVEVERVEGGACQVILKVSSADGKPAEGLRVSLLAGDREQASYLMRQGQAAFENVTKGNYNLFISRAGSSLGTITLGIEAES